MSSTFRNVMILAIISSIGSKLSGFAYQIVSVPLIANVLNTSNFSLFLIYSGFTTWLSLLALGIAPTVTKIASDKNKENILPAVYYVSCLIVFFIFSIIGTVLLFVFPLLNNVSVLFSSENKIIFWVAYITFSLSIVLSISDAVNQGKKKQHVNNLNFLIGNLINIAAIYIVSRYFKIGEQGLALIFIASQIGFIFTRIINTLYVSTQLGFVTLKIPKGFVHEFLKNSGSFLFVQLSVLLSQQALVILVLEHSGDKLSGKLSLVFRTYAILGSLIAMINQPLWPLLNTALSEKNHKWVLQIYRKITLLYFSYGTFIVFLLFSFGTYVYTKWTNGAYLFSKTELMLIGIHFLLVCFAQASVAILMGKGLFSQMAIILIIEAISSYILIFIMNIYVPNLSLVIIMSALIIANLSTSCWMLPRKAYSNLRLNSE